MSNYEYQHVFTDEYNKYFRKAHELLLEIAVQFNKPVNALRYKDIISFFQANFNLHFTFFEADPVEIYGDEGWGKSNPDSSWIKYKDTVTNADFCFLESEIVDRISGITIPDGRRTLIMINQDRVYSRIIFTILHELSHFYFHIRDKSKQQAFVSLTSEKVEGHYSEEIIPFENEANIIASILFCSTERLEYMLAKKYSFKDLCRSVEMSEPAMHNRLLNYFEHVLRFPSPLALRYVWRFRDNDPQTRNLIRYKVNTLVDRKAAAEERRILIQCQAAYVDKLKESEFWGEIVSNMGIEEELHEFYEGDYYN
ncbi:ImmA/IrrE family metallo-endopeptidase [Enterococcus dongliensis]|uniref:ImmA/IrrE family metallo-endopeptidase n=1 Tax=Enterococcus dongliensis TaxID=2559925 RepID=UPI00288CBE21|nr:ImmA/IrrE family metallo-endopeptidase [Enterococcus dongliensis]MDT2613129.1 ImmA/IrrE family metallo-endopeptidase [Enterococcus dongliensis]